MDASDWFAGDDDDAPAGAVVIEVWAVNAPTFAAFQRCKLSGVSGGFGVMWQGFTALEIEAAMRQVRIPDDDQPRVSGELDWLGRLVAGGLNKQQRKRSSG